MLFEEIDGLRTALDTQLDQIAGLGRRLAESEGIAQQALQDARAERDSIAAERDRAVAERDQAVAELDQAVAELDQAVAERDRAVVARDLTLTGQGGLQQRHALQITLIHKLYASWQNGPAVGVPGFARQVEIIAATPLFDETWYRARYPDVAASGFSSREHYVRSGAFEGRNPGPGFDTMAYYLANPDVAQAGWPALVHYVGFGQAEGRKAA
jgi:hypothetical protein